MGQATPIECAAMSASRGFLDGLMDSSLKSRAFLEITLRCASTMFIAQSIAHSRMRRSAAAVSGPAQEIRDGVG